MKVELKNIYLGKIGINEGETLNIIEENHRFYYDKEKSFNHALDIDTGQLLFVPNVEDLLDGVITPNSKYVILTEKLIIKAGQEDDIRIKCQQFLPTYNKYIDYLTETKDKPKIR